MTVSTSRGDDGVALLRAGRAIEAVDVLRQAVAAGEEGAEDLLARAYLDSGSWHAAAEWLSRLVEAGRTEFARRLGVALVGVGDTDTAEAAFRHAMATGDIAAANDLAILLRDRGRPAEAQLVLEQAIAADDPVAPANLVELYLEAGDLRAAVDTAQRYVDEARPDTLVALGDVRVAQDRGAEAERLYRQAAQLGAARAHTACGAYLVSIGAIEAAEREFRAAVRAGEPRWALTMGRFLLDTDRVEEAREYLQAGADSGDVEAAEILGELDGVDPTDD
ncbi:MAG: tetratricopeptide repeat protein [Pseudonocardia sp.]|nr:tetratricopeptide repeat protein [Pseudonocardia sp.]